MKRKNVSLIAGAAICALTVLLTAVYVSLSGMFVQAEYIPPDDIAGYAEEAILAVTQSGLLSNETVNGKVCFHPERAVTRAELAGALIRLLGISAESYETIEVGFADEYRIKAGDLAYIRAAVAGGYMKLYSDYTFRPEESITREETADIIGSLFSGAISAGKSSHFSDFDEISEHFFENAKKTVDHLIMIGYPDGTFLPKNELTREELALILYRLTQNEHFTQRNS
jgi:hypothetical protein